MLKLSKSILVILTAVFAASMALQVCCHQDWSEFFAHDHPSENAAHSHSHDHNRSSSSDEECGPHKYKDLVKSDKLEASSQLTLRSFVVTTTGQMMEVFPQVRKNNPFRLIFFNKVGPPIYLLNSVFLN